MFLKRITIFYLLTLALIVGVTFFNSFHSSFKMDDHDFFNDPKIRNPKLIAYNWIPEPDRHLGLSKSSEESSYRPVTNTALAFMFHNFGEHVVLYHGVMVIVFFVGCAFIYWFVFLLSADALIAFLTSVLFAVHPINGLAVNYVVASAYGLQLCFALLSLIFFIKTFSSRNQILSLIFALVMFVVSLGVHETSLIIPVYMMLIGWFLNKESLSRLFLKVAPFFAVLMIYIVFRMRYASLHDGVLSKYGDFQMSIFEFAATFIKLINWYLSKLFIPDGVVLMWSSKIIQEGVWLWMLLGVFLLASFFWLIIKFGRSLIAVSLTFFVIGFIPIIGACLFRPTTGLVMEPHWMFLSSVGFFMVSAIGLVRIIRYRPWIGILLCVVLLSGLIKLSHVYNEIWSDEKTYGYFWLKEAPAFKTTQFFIAYSLIKDGQYDQARQLLLMAREGIFSDWQIYSNLGLMDFNEHHYDRAIQNYQKALSFNPNSSEVYNNLAVIYEFQGHFKDAIEANQKALALNRNLVEPRLNLARMALLNNDLKTAVLLYRENLAIFPYERRSLVLYWLALIERGDREQFDALFNDIMDKCRDVEMLTELATIASNKGWYVPSLDLYMQVIRIDPRYKPGYIQAGVLLANLNEFERAIKLWNRALEIDPNDLDVKRLIQQAKQEITKTKQLTNN